MHKMFGFIIIYEPTIPGNSYLLDDELVLWFSKRLSWRFYIFPYKLIDLTHTLDRGIPTWNGGCGFNSSWSAPCCILGIA